jgi:FkbM family methyltransferase
MGFKSSLRKAIEPLAQKMIRGTLRSMSYSASGEDRLVLSWLEITYKCDIRDIRYCDIGANHPRDLSNTFLFYEFGSSGVLVEPDPDLCALLREQRPRDTILNAGVAFDDRRSATLKRFPAKVFNTFSDKHAQGTVTHSKSWNKDQRQEIVDEIEVPLLTAADVLAKLDRVDFISIDAEGVDLAILKSIDLNRFRPKLICVEASSHPTEFDGFLKQFGYELISRTPDNLIYRLV